MTAWVPRWEPAGDALAVALQGLTDWVSHDAVLAVVDAFGGSVPSGEPETKLRWLDEFAASEWDFRGGAERNLAKPVTFTAEQLVAIRRAAAATGMRATSPAFRRADAVVMTGGMVRAGIVKPRYVAALLDRGLSTDEVVFLGAHRAFRGDEIHHAALLGVDGSDETDAMVAGVEAAFPAHGRRRVTTSGSGYARHTVVTWPEQPHPELSVVAAPSSDPSRRRAHTRDTFEHWAASTTARSVVVVTTPVYVPYQAACAVEVFGLGYGMHVETVGVDAASNDLGPLTQQFGPQQQLQELRSAVRGMRSLWNALSAGDTRT